MKALFVSVLMMSSSLSFAQAISVDAVKSLIQERQVQLELVSAGMSKKVTTIGSFITEAGTECGYKQVAVQTVLKIEAEKMFVYSQETYSPANTAACRDSGTRPYAQKILSHEALPKIADDLAALDAQAAGITSIERSGDVVTIKLNVNSDLVTVSYDYSKSSFRNLVLNQGTGYSTTTADAQDVSPQSIDLSNVLFCVDDESECVPGNYSDILF